MKPARRRFAAPLLAVCLLALWLILARSVSVGHLLAGSAIALIVAHAFPLLRPTHGRMASPWLVIRFLGRVAGDVVCSNLEVARDVLCAWRRPVPRFVVIPLELRDPAGLVALAWVTTIVPGTVWSELAVDRSALLLHVWDVADAAEYVARFKARYERPLQEIFE